MEELCVYEYFATTTSMGRKAAAKYEHFDYQEEHPLYGLEVVVYDVVARKEGVRKVTSFSFSFLPDAKNLGGTILAPKEVKKQKKRRFCGGPVAAPPVEPTTEGCKELREAYATRFLVLFHHSRTLEEQTGHRQSAVKRLQKCLKDGEISEDSLRIASNIQNIHNSLRAGVPEERLVTRTDEFDWYVSCLPSHFSTLLHKH
jgi:hypothetical protein